MIHWHNDPDGYLVETLTALGAVLALAESDAIGPVQWFSRWIAEGGHAGSAVLAIDGHTAGVLQGENAGQGLLVVWAIENGITSNELVLMLLGEGYGSASASADNARDGGGNTDSSSNSSNSSNSSAFILRGTAALSLTAHATLSRVKVFTALPLQAKATLRWISSATLKAIKPIKAKAAFRFIARHGTAQPPSGLAMHMKIIADPYRPEVIRDQYLRIWFNGQPSQCRISLKMDDNAEFEPAFTWQNPGNTRPAIVKIDSAEIPSDGQTHRITVSVWQQVGSQTSARSTISDFAKTPNIRPANQPEWCGATTIRQGEVIRQKVNGYLTVVGHTSDLTRIDWRHSGAVQIMARIPRHPKPGKTIDSTLIVGYADHDETTFYAEQIGAQLDWTTGLPEPVTFGVAAIQHGTFGPVTWANAPVNILAVYPNPTDISTNPDVIAGTVETLDLGGMKEKIGQQVFAQFGWPYPGYYDSVTAEVRTRRDTVRTTIDKTLRRIKDITRQGGSVTLDDLGRFEARWNEARTVRSVAFIASLGFIEGTKAGYVLTDQQAKALKP